LDAELRERLGVIRTGRITGSAARRPWQQSFHEQSTRGFPKTAEESMRIWNHDKILSEYGLGGPEFEPDVIVTRFSPEDQLTHGHITRRPSHSGAGSLRVFR